MRRFYEQVRADDTTFYFYTECAICRKRKYGKRLPLLCRSKKLLQGGKEGLRQKIYKHYHAAAVQELAIQLNRCEHCGHWVCDDCYRNGDLESCCLNCAANSQDEVRRMKNELSEACDS